MLIQRIIYYLAQGKIATLSQERQMQNRHDLSDSGSQCESSDVPGQANIPPNLDAEEEIPARPVDPTRYGDWEKNGRCIDF